ncbi:MAG TPA: TadE family protein [Geminicoccaceae bacterium]|nr:TadE family protein [Geminicoccaceae bacterium]
MRRLLPLLRRLTRDDRGGVTVEFVATLPMILAALAIMFEFGRGLWYHHVVTKGVRDAARYAARYPALGSDCTDLDEDADFLEGVRCVALSGAPDGTSSPVFWTDLDTVTVQMAATALDLRVPGACTITVRAEVPYNLTLLTAFSGFWEVDPGITITAQDQARYVGD